MIQILTILAQFQRRPNCGASEASDKCVSVLPEVSAGRGQLQNGLSIFFGVLAAVAIVVIIIAGINFITAEGNPEKLTKAKRAITYALIGLVICLSAEAVVLFLIGELG